MAIFCPTCGTLVEAAAGAVESGRPSRCRRCGTNWVARAARPDGPFGRRRKLALPDFSDVSDAIVIEDEPAAKPTPPLSRPSLPPQPEIATPDAAPVPRLRPVLRVTAIAFAATVGVALLKTPILAALPQPGAPVLAKAGLQFRGIRSETLQGSTPTLVVEGEVVNTSTAPLDLPRLRIVLKSSDGKDVVAWLLDPAVHRLSPGQSIGFRSARAAPPASATQVALSLATDQ